MQIFFDLEEAMREDVNKIRLWRSIFLVLYGYPVVVPAQQQQVIVSNHPHQSSPPPQQHHNYSKKKKKKYQRRRQVDLPPAGSYLDPQLYTGEPFVATSGGYVVPLETAASVCHIHGIQYVTPAFHQRLPDEGFVSLQHSPYLPDVAAEPPTAEVHTPDGTNSQSDSSRTVFSDLQDTERQQIQEILQEHNKVSKSDSTESSDSGVSESEEALAAEASSDELETRQDSLATEVTPESEDSSDAAADTTTSTLQCQEDLLTTPEVEDTPYVSIQHDTVTAELCSASVQAELCSTSVQAELCSASVQAELCSTSVQAELYSTSVQAELCSASVQAELCSASVQAELYSTSVQAELCSSSVQADVDLSVSKESQACQTEESISEDQTTCQEVVVLHVSDSLDGEAADSENESENIPESITADTETSDHQEEEQPACLRAVAEEEDDTATEECNDNTVLTVANAEDDSCVTEIPCESESSEKSSSDTSVRDSEILAQVAEEETLSSNTTVIDVAVDNQNFLSSTEIKSDNYETPSDDCINSSSTIDETIPCKSEGNSLEEENLTDEDFDSEVLPNEKIISNKEIYESKDENNISIGRIKDLKVTEAVTRWIREVTPEKAFTLSQEFQSRLLADQESVGEMDTEDEYIEDEMAPEAKPDIILEPKNVKSNPLVAPSSESPVLGADGCGKRVAFMNKFRGTTPDTIDDYDGSSTISNLSVGNVHSEASSCLASVNQSFDEDAEKYAGNPEMYDPSAYAKYYQLGIEVDEITPTATPPLVLEGSRGATPFPLINSETVSECGSEDIDSVPLKYEIPRQYTDTSPLSLATEILKAEKVINNMTHITGDRESLAVAEQTYGNPDKYLKHYDAISHNEVSDSGVQSEDSSDETEGRSIVSSGVGSSLASTPAVSPAHNLMGMPPLQPYPLKNLSAGEGPVPYKTVCCAVM
ncbi:hypothetical protein GWK47_051673 [Chionoecetes opilio]|uniref:Uncharacterized protein n=1 Tax=Chionoecetes opilio TaxID=41210 RepID=A0A8J4Y9P2_CHIOP|nr:hypothetical protein GWK47_051673 [Chionoecetes opilio]